MAKAESWEKLHSRGERQLERAVRKFLKSQDQRIKDALGPQLLTTGLDLYFRPQDEANRMIAAVTDILLTQMASGAVRVIDQASTPGGKKAFSFAKFKLPGRVQTAITTALGEIAKAPHWAKIQSNRAANVAGAIGEMIGQGLSLPNMTKKLGSILSGIGRVAAKAIATTETTGALNAGHQAGYDSLADSGLIAKKQWLGILDKKIRPSHLQSHLQTVLVKENFIVGGFQTPYPGWWGLPARQRVRCRCTTVAVFENIAGEEVTKPTTGEDIQIDLELAAEEAGVEIDATGPEADDNE